MGRFENIFGLERRERSLLNIARSGKMGWVRQEDGETDRANGPIRTTENEAERKGTVYSCAAAARCDEPRNVAAALDVSYSAAAKAIQRVKDRISTMLVDEPSERESKGSSLRSSEN